MQFNHDGMVFSDKKGLGHAASVVIGAGVGFGKERDFGRLYGIAQPVIDCDCTQYSAIGNCGITVSKAKETDKEGIRSEGRFSLPLT